MFDKYPKVQSTAHLDPRWNTARAKDAEVEEKALCCGIAQQDPLLWHTGPESTYNVMISQFFLLCSEGLFWNNAPKVYVFDEIMNVHKHIIFFRILDCLDVFMKIHQQKLKLNQLSYTEINLRNTTETLRMMDRTEIKSGSA